MKNNSLIPLFFCLMMLFFPIQKSVGQNKEATESNQTLKEESLSLLKQKAKNGEGIVQFELGRMYYDGLGVEEDFTQATYWLEKAANQGHALAQFELGMMYLGGENREGDGEGQDSVQAAKWLEKATEQGYALAQFELGLMYYDGEGVEQDFTRAKGLVQELAEQGHVCAQTKMGGICKGERDYKQAIQWFQKAMEQGDMYAQFALSDMYAHGFGVEKDSRKAEHLYFEAKNQILQRNIEHAKLMRKHANRTNVKQNESCPSIFNR